MAFIRSKKAGRLALSLILAGLPVMWAGSAFAKMNTLPKWMVEKVEPYVNSGTWNAISQELLTTGFITVHGSHMDIYPQNVDPSASGLVQNTNGSMTIAGPTNGTYTATWTSSPTILASGATVMLLGYNTPTPNVTTTPETIALGTVQTAGTAVVNFPATDFYGTTTSPEYFEMMVIYATTPIGDTPEVPYAAGLPLVAGLLLAGVYGLRHRLA
ncbi:MAG: hypothetical protein OWQ57_12465 [Sulfobacillus sp.]|nr:hypothetical protein [Sulfobacillus sp.]